jgi:thioredoxin reductase (NADPH)
LRVHLGSASLEAKHVLVATGGFGIPRRLGILGESAARVSYRFIEGAPYAGQEILVVGGGNSAAEAALWLHEAGARVTLSLRRPSFAPRDGVHDSFTSVKSYNTDRLQALARRGELRILFSSHLVALTPTSALLQLAAGRCAIPCNHVFALLGADPDLGLLRGVDAEIAADGRPVYHPETFETTVPGLYVAGHLTRAIHLAPAIAVPRRIVRRIAGERITTQGRWLLDAVAQSVKTLRKRSALARRLVAASPALRRAIQRIDAANVMWERPPSLLRQLIRRHPRLRRAARSLRALAAS